DESFRPGPDVVPVELERWGHRFRHARSVHGPEPSHVVRLDGRGPWLATTAVQAVGGGVSVQTLVDGRRTDGMTTSLASHGSFSLFVPADSALLEARVERGADHLRRLGVHLYELV